MTLFVDFVRLFCLFVCTFDRAFDLIVIDCCCCCLCHLFIAGKRASCDDTKNGNVSGGKFVMLDFNSAL